MAQHTARNWGAVGLLALLFWPKKAGAGSGLTPPQALPKAAPGERPAASPRPEASKVEPSSIPSRSDEEELPDRSDEEELPGDGDVSARIRARLLKEKAEREALDKAEQEAAAQLAAKKKAAAKKKKAAEGDDHDEPKDKAPKAAPASKLTREETDAREKRAQQFAAKQHQIYTEAGQLPEIAAAQALAVYLLGGGAKPSFIRQYQHMMGLPNESGSFDLATQASVEQLLGPDVVMVANNMQLENLKGEDPAQAAAESLALYVMAMQGKTPPDEVPREFFVALQMQFMAPISGNYDKATKEALVKHGITPP